jgi:hypothetical protein
MGIYDKAPIMSNIVQQTQVYGFGTTVTCPAFGSAVTAGNAIAMVANIYPYTLAPNNITSIGDGTANVYKLVLLFVQPSLTFPVTFTASPSGTSGTLTSGLGAATGTQLTLVFSDGEIRQASGTNGNTAISWTTALTGSPAISATVLGNAAGYAMWVASNSVAGIATPKIAATGGGIVALYGAEITNVGTGSIVLGTANNVQFGPGTSPNAINSGSITVNQTAVLFGFCMDASTLTTTGVTGGTGFSAQAPVWNTGTYNSALAEDATINTSSAATFTASNGPSTYFSMAMALAGPGPFTPFTQTQFFVIDTIIQQ